jgi:hypothetical protein
MRIPELICAWQPGATTITAPARPDIDTTPLLRLAATFEPDHPAHRTLLNLARVAQHRTTTAALQDLQILHESIIRGSGPDVPTAIAAVPLPVPETECEDLDTTTRRAGWLDVLGHCDTLSVQCIREARAWDGGKDFPFSNPEEIDPTTHQATSGSSDCCPSSTPPHSNSSTTKAPVTPSPTQPPMHP